MVDWQTLWEQLRVRRNGPPPPWQDLRTQVAFVSRCITDASPDTNLEGLSCAIGDLRRELEKPWRLSTRHPLTGTVLEELSDEMNRLERQLDRLVRLREEQYGMDRLLKANVRDHSYDEDPLDHLMGTMRQSRPARTLQTSQGPIHGVVLLMSDLERLFGNGSQAARRHRPLINPGSLTDRALLKNPPKEYHDLMEGHDTADLPQYNEIFGRELTGNCSSHGDSITYCPPLDKATLQKAVRRRRDALTHSDSTNSVDQFSDGLKIHSRPRLPTYEEAREIKRSRFVVDPRSRLSSYGAQQLGIQEQQAAKVARRRETSPTRQIGERKSSSCSPKPRTRIPLHAIPGPTRPCPDSPRKSPKKVECRAEKYREPCRSDYCRAPKCTWERWKAGEQDYQRNLGTFLRNRNVTDKPPLQEPIGIEDIGYISTESPAWSWAEQRSIDVDTLSENTAYQPELRDVDNLSNNIVYKPELRGGALYGFWFINSRGNEYFCDVDEEYLTDRFNLTGLNTEVQYYQYALDLITDVFDLDCEDEMREQIEKSARHLYGLVHARYIVTTRGQQKMMEKYKIGDFGKCPRVACDGQNLLPMGQNDVSNMSAVKLYCARCEDLYNPKSSRHAAIDGAYFGTSFHNIFFQVYPHLQPPKSQRRYEPRIYGFKVHATAALARWQADQRDKMKERLRLEGLETGFEEEEREDEMEESEEEEGLDGIDDMFEGQRSGAATRR